MSSNRRQRREAELADRRQRRRGPQPARGQLPIVQLSLAAVGLGIAIVLVWALFLQPPRGPATADVRAPLQPAPYELADGRALGSADAPLTVEVWSDFQCPVCATLATTYQPRLIRQYVETGRVRLVYRDFAFLGAESVDAAVGARCAERENRYWQFHDLLFANHGGENRGAFSADRLAALAAVAGLALDEFRACGADPAVRQAVADETAHGGAIGIDSTPTLFVGDQKVVGLPRTYEQLTMLIDTLLAEDAAGQ